jgi:uncharacterized phage protein (TIGR02220 family)
MKKDAYYFPHFSNARHDRKIQRLRKELGIEGYGIYFMLLETLRDQHDLTFPMKDLDLLADEFGTSEQKIRVTICNYGLFEIDDNELFFSPKMLVFLEPYFKGKEQRRKAIESRWSKKSEVLELELLDNQEDNTAVLLPNYDRNTDVIQSKVKESKVKESKEEESILNIDEQFDDFSVVRDIISYLNIVTDRNHRANKGSSNAKLISARIKEGYCLEDFKKVIDVKSSQWLKNKDMEKYLRPETLFSKSKFDGYLNEAPSVSKTNNQMFSAQRTRDDFFTEENYKSYCLKNNIEYKPIENE